MEIEGHFIKDSEIIGIGPMMQKGTTDPIELQLYNTKKFYFDVHLRHRPSITIETKFLQVGYKDDNGEENEKAREEYKKFYERYQEVKKKIIALVETTGEIY